MILNFFLNKAYGSNLSWKCEVQKGKSEVLNFVNTNRGQHNGRIKQYNSEVALQKEH